MGGFSGRVAWGPQNGTFREVPGAVLALSPRVLGLEFAPRMPIRGLAQQRLQLFILPRPERPLLFSAYTFLKNELPNDGSQFSPPPTKTLPVRVWELPVRVPHTF